MSGEERRVAAHWQRSNLIFEKSSPLSTEPSYSGTIQECQFERMQGQKLSKTIGYGSKAK